MTEQKMAPCPLCGSPGVFHAAASAGLHDMASCSNPRCILHENYQDEVNRHVRFDEWPRRDWRELEASQSAGGCVFECRNADGSPTLLGAGVAWCRTHGFDCPSLKPTQGRNDDRGE